MTITKKLFLISASLLVAKKGNRKAFKSFRQRQASLETVSWLVASCIKVFLVVRLGGPLAHELLRTLRIVVVQEPSEITK